MPPGLSEKEKGRSISDIFRAAFPEVAVGYDATSRSFLGVKVPSHNKRRFRGGNARPVVWEEREHEEERVRSVWAEEPATEFEKSFFF